MTDFKEPIVLEIDKILPSVPMCYVEIDLRVVVLPHKKIMKLVKEKKEEKKELVKDQECLPKFSSE